MADNQGENEMTISTTPRFKEMMAEDARRIAAEWLEMGSVAAKDMLWMTIDAMRNGEPLPEPAEMAKAELHSYLPAHEVEIGWPIFVAKLRATLRLS